MPFGRWARRAGSRAGVAAAGAAAAVCPIAAPLSPAAPKCPDIEVVFARGTDEPAGIGNVGKAFVDTLRPMVKGSSVDTYAVEYPASWDFMKAAAGATDMSKRIQATAARCPKTKIVMGGYS